MEPDSFNWYKQGERERARARCALAYKALKCFGINYFKMYESEKGVIY